MKKPKIIKRKKITYVVYEDSVVVGIGDWQWMSYNQYENWNRRGITEFRNIILKSRDNEYDNAVDMMSLAYRCGIKSAYTIKPEEIV